jgi:hypothetical protein
MNVKVHKCQPRNYCSTERVGVEFYFFSSGYNALCVSFNDESCGCVNNFSNSMTSGMMEAGVSAFVLMPANRRMRPNLIVLNRQFLRALSSIFNAACEFSVKLH